MSRFFNKSQSIDALTTKEIDKFLEEEQLKGKVTPSRVRDFYNAASHILSGKKIDLVDDINYDQFECKNDKDKKRIDKLRDDELNYLKNVNKDVLTSNRLLKAAAALSYKYEHGNGREKSDVNEYLRRLFECHEDSDGKGLDCSFAEAIECDVAFMKYIALLAKKRAFSKMGSKLVKEEGGNTVKHSYMENFSEVFSIDMIDSVRPDFNRKLATKDLYVKTRFSKYNKAQNLVILIDNSGSMDDYHKKAMLKAAITLKLKEHSEVNNIYIGIFEKQVYGFVKVEKGMKFTDLDFITLSQGGTDVNGCIKSTIKQIKGRKLDNIRGGQHELSDDHFEIMVINDGADSVDASYHPEIKIHAICLMQSNPALKNICHRSSGTYHYLTED